jgi:hypothetical protein
MPAYARSHIVPPDEIGVYHCVARCVRRAFLCGVDPLTNHDYDYRNEWIRERLELLASVFAIDICAADPARQVSVTSRLDRSTASGGESRGDPDSARAHSGATGNRRRRLDRDSAAIRSPVHDKIYRTALLRVTTIIDRPSIAVIDGKSSIWQVLGVPVASSSEHDTGLALREKPSGPTIMPGLRGVSLGASRGQPWGLRAVSLGLWFSPENPRRRQEPTVFYVRHPDPDPLPAAVGAATIVGTCYPAKQRAGVTTNIGSRSCRRAIVRPRRGTDADDTGRGRHGQLVRGGRRAGARLAQRHGGARRASGGPLARLSVRHHELQGPDGQVVKRPTSF